MIKVYSCGKSMEMGLPIVAQFNGVQEEYECITFSDGEMEVHFNESVRGDDVFLIQSITSADALMELMLAINAAKLASAKSVTAVVPYLGYARQDRKSRPRVSLGAKVVLQAIESAGANRIITMDLHAAQEVGFVDIPVDHLRATSLFIPFLKGCEEMVLVAPDAGAAKNVSLYASALGWQMVICHKSRNGINHVENMTLIGSVEGKEVVIIDDMADTAGTLVKCAQLLKDKGAKIITVMFTHPVLSGPAVERLSKSVISQIVTSNTIGAAGKLNELFDKSRKVINKIAITELFSKAIDNAYNGRSIEDLFVVRHQ